MATPGRVAVLQIANDLAVLTSIHQYLTAIEFDETTEATETSPLNDKYKWFDSGMRSASFSIEGNWEPEIDSLLGELLDGTQRAFAYGPAGNTAGRRKFTGALFATNFHISTDVGSVGAFTADLIVSEAYVRDTW